MKFIINLYFYLKYYYDINCEHSHVILQDRSNISRYNNGPPATKIEASIP